VRAEPGDFIALLFDSSPKRRRLLGNFIKHQ
jgi:hypothetical protein